MPKVIATSTEAGDARFTLERGGLDGKFDAVVTGDRVERGKPAPDIFLAAAAEAGVEAAACVAFEDSDAGVLAASSAGMWTVMVPDMKPPSDEAGERATGSWAPWRKRRPCCATSPPHKSMKTGDLGVDLDYLIS